MWFNKGDQNSLESGLKRPRGNELCRRLHPNDSRNPFSFTVAPQGVIFGEGGPRQRWIGCFRKQLTCAKTFFHLHHLSFMPLCAPNLRPAGTSFQRKEGSIHSKRPTFSLLPLEGAARRSETGLAPPYVGNAFPPYRYPHHFRASPFKKSTRSVAPPKPSPRGEGWRYGIIII